MAVLHGKNLLDIIHKLFNQTFHLWPMQVAAAHFVLIAAAQLLFLYEAGIANCRRSLALMSHGKHVY